MKNSIYVHLYEDGNKAVIVEFGTGSIGIGLGSEKTKGLPIHLQELNELKKIGEFLTEEERIKMKRLTRYEISAVKDDVYLENGEVRITNPDIKVCLACDVGDFENKTEEIIRRQKYKRCLAMAEWCDAEADCADADGDYNDMCFYQKWHEKWLELADKFKENK